MATNCSSFVLKGRIVDTDKKMVSVKLKGRRRLVVDVELTEKTIGDLNDPDPSIYKKAERSVCLAFRAAMKERGEDITVTFNQLVLPDPEPIQQPHASQVRSSYTK